MALPASRLRPPAEEPASPEAFPSTDLFECECRHCGGLFHAPSLRRTTCDECKREHNRLAQERYRKNHADSVAAYNQVYRQTHKAELNEAARLRRQGESPVADKRLRARGFRRCDNCGGWMNLKDSKSRRRFCAHCKQQRRAESVARSREAPQPQPKNASAPPAPVAVEAPAGSGAFGWYLAFCRLAPELPAPPAKPQPSRLYALDPEVQANMANLPDGTILMARPHWPGSRQDHPRPKVEKPKRQRFRCVFTGKWRWVPLGFEVPLTQEELANGEQPELTGQLHYDWNQRRGCWEMWQLVVRPTDPRRDPWNLPSPSKVPPLPEDWPVLPGYEPWAGGRPAATSIGRPPRHLWKHGLLARIDGVVLGLRPVYEDEE